MRYHLTGNRHYARKQQQSDIYSNRMLNHFDNYRTISLTRPTSPLSRRTLIPWGWVCDLVRISLTAPLVNFPVRWSFFNTIRTWRPGDIFTQFASFMTLILLPPKGGFPPGNVYSYEHYIQNRTLKTNDRVLCFFYSNKSCCHQNYTKNICVLSIINEIISGNKQNHAD